MTVKQTKGKAGDCKAAQNPRVGRLSDRPELATPAFQSCLAQEVILMHLWVKVVSIFGTIVLKFRWKRR